MLSDMFLREQHTWTRITVTDVPVFFYSRYTLQRCHGCGNDAVVVMDMELEKLILSAY